MNRDELLVRLAERHRPRVGPYPPEAGADARLRAVQCPACDGNAWRVIDPATDSQVRCELWHAAVDLGVVTDLEPVIT